MRLCTLMISCAMPVLAQDFSLALPLDCDLNDTCYIQNYVDRDPTGAVLDFQCGVLTYDGHKGTDFGLPSLSDMEAGVNVTASAPGIVRGTRNDMRDVLFTIDRRAEIDGRDCGNGVVIAHENGWETQYCHLKQGSVTVQTGDQVGAGDVLGQVGLSGRTQFPHVHLSLRRNGQMIDPFDPDGTATCDTPADDTLWADRLDTPAGGIINTGFATDLPDYEAVKAGTAGAMTLRPDAPIVLWALAFGARPDDVVTLTISGPTGQIFQTEDRLERAQAMVMRAGGRNPPDAGWPTGEYTGTAIHSRDGAVLNQQVVHITLP